MRLLETFDHESEGRKFAQILTQHGITNIFEAPVNRNWESPLYGTSMGKVWIYDEDQVEDARRLLEEYRKNPDASQFQITATKDETKYEKKEEISPPLVKAKISNRKHFGSLTFYLIMLCSWIFIWGNLTAPNLESIPTAIPATPLLAPPIDKQLFFDYPKAFSIIDRLVSLYSIEKLYTPTDLPKEGQYLLSEYLKTPYWQGYYKMIVQFFRDPTHTSFTINAPLFEKIREGEVWRLWSPCLLHSDIFHILFNLMWLAILGIQLEARMGMIRYLLFMLITGIFSNFAQYMMSGANFIGISGVLCAMLAYIWIRQKRAPWEGYLLQRGTLGLIAFFILAMFSIQVASFIAEAFYNVSFSPGVANTAHLSGAVIGYCLGRFNLLGWKV